MDPTQPSGLGEGRGYFLLEDWEANFRGRMRTLRESNGLTQTELARRLNERYKLPFHQQTVDRVEAGKRPIRLNEAFCIAEALDVTLEAMVARDADEEGVALALSAAIRRFEHRAAGFAGDVAETFFTIEDDAQYLQREWERYKQARGELGLEVDPELAADVRRYLTRFERAQTGFQLLLELDDL